MLLARAAFARQRLVSFIMPRHLYLDASPPPYNGSRDVLDKDAFKKTFNVLGACVAPEKTRVLLKAGELKKCVYLSPPSWISSNHFAMQLSHGPAKNPDGGIRSIST